MNIFPKAKILSIPFSISVPMNNNNNNNKKDLCKIFAQITARQPRIYKWNPVKEKMYISIENNII